MPQELLGSLRKLFNRKAQEHAERAAEPARLGPKSQHLEEPYERSSQYTERSSHVSSQWTLNLTDRSSAVTDRSSVVTDRSSAVTNRSSVFSRSSARSSQQAHAVRALQLIKEHTEDRSSAGERISAYLRGIIGGPFAKLPKSQPNTPTAPHRLPSRPCAEPHRSAELPCEHHGEGQRSLTSHSSPLDDLSDGLRQFSNSSATSKAAGRSLVATASLSSLPVGSTRAASDPNLIVVCEQLPAILRRKRWDADDFDVLDKCHSGYASAVYRAQCRLSGQLVALKVYQPSKLHVISQFQLQREARLQAAMRHPNIIRLYAAFKYRECVVLVQEWADGGDLLQHLLQHNTRMSEQQATNVVLLPLLRALHYLHSRLTVHRDVKLENILLSGPQMTLKLADFGLCISLGEERSVTRAGTLDYMAPEVLKCPQKHLPLDNKGRTDLAYTSAVDVWAVGVVAYELLNGCPPFTSHSKQETEERINSGLMPEFVVNVTPDAIDFVYCCLRRSASQRPDVQQLLRHPWIKAHTCTTDLPRPVPSSSLSEPAACYDAPDEPEAAGDLHVSEATLASLRSSARRSSTLPHIPVLHSVLPPLATPHLPGPLVSEWLAAVNHHQQVPAAVPAASPHPRRPPCDMAGMLVSAKRHDKPPMFQCTPDVLAHAAAGHETLELSGRGSGDQEGHSGPNSPPCGASTCSQANCHRTSYASSSGSVHTIYSTASESKGHRPHDKLALAKLMHPPILEKAGEEDEKARLTPQPAHRATFPTTHAYPNAVAPGNLAIPGTVEGCSVIQGQDPINTVPASFSHSSSHMAHKLAARPPVRKSEPASLPS